MRRSNVMKALGAGLVLLASGCTAPKVLVSNSFVGERSTKYIMQVTANETVSLSNGRSAQRGLYNYSIELCDFDAGGNEVQCHETLLLQNVTIAP